MKKLLFAVSVLISFQSTLPIFAFAEDEKICDKTYLSEACDVPAAIDASLSTGSIVGAAVLHRSANDINKKYKNKKYLANANANYLVSVYSPDYFQKNYPAIGNELENKRIIERRILENKASLLVLEKKIGEAAFDAIPEEKHQFQNAAGTLRDGIKRDQIALAESALSLERYFGAFQPKKNDLEYKKLLEEAMGTDGHDLKDKFQHVEFSQQKFAKLSEERRLLLARVQILDQERSVALPNTDAAKKLNIEIDALERQIKGINLAVEEMLSNRSLMNANAMSLIEGAKRNVIDAPRFYKPGTVVGKRILGSALGLLGITQTIALGKNIVTSIGGNTNDELLPTPGRFIMNQFASGNNEVESGKKIPSSTTEFINSNPLIIDTIGSAKP